MKKIIVSSISAIAFTAILSQSAFAAFDAGTATSYKSVYGNNKNQCYWILKDKANFSPAQLKGCGYEAPVIIEEELIATVVKPIIAEEINIRAALLFAFDSDVLSSNARYIIDERTAKYRNRGRLTSNVQVVGHADSTGPESYNQNLSERRARSVARYLAQNTNITDDKLNVYGQGESEPVASNATRAGRSENRRVIIVLNAEVE